MITPNEALKIILENTEPLSEEKISLEKSYGRVLSRDIWAVENLPSFDNSAMDGFAVQSNSLSGASETSPIVLPVQSVSKAGTSSPLSLKEKHAIRIMTGAPIPLGADAIAIKETTDSQSSDEVRFFYPATGGDHIRKMGEDVKKDDLLLKKGTSLRSYEISLLAAQGITQFYVIGLPQVCVISTGDELVSPSSAISYGQIRNSNGPAISSSLAHWGVEAIECEIVPDNSKKLEEVLRKKLSKNDLFIISGGVSVGDFDFTKETLEKMGFQILFWKAAIKPGKPLLFAKKMDSESPKYVFGLPGNPVSALVCLEEFVRVALENLKGKKPTYPSYHLKGNVTNSYVKPMNRQQYIFCQVTELENQFQIDIIRPQGAAMMGMATRANALALAPIGISQIKPGDFLNFRWLK
ncbi:MAG: gephyrin-like molybdotransferase Glp [Elusimicrobiota bacterium]